MTAPAPSSQARANDLQERIRALELLGGEAIGRTAREMLALLISASHGDIAELIGLVDQVRQEQRDQRDMVTALAGTVGEVLQRQRTLEALMRETIEGLRMDRAVSDA